MTHRLLLLLIISIGILSCQNDNKDQAYDGELLKKMSPLRTGVFFANGIEDSWKRNTFLYNYFYYGAGVTMGDINNDGLTDLFFTGNDVPNVLYLNKGNMEFEDISLAAFQTSVKWATSATMVDVNRDGYLDIYVCNGGPNYELGLLKNDLLINNKDNTFTNQADKYGIADYGRSSGASFFDYDNDGDLDLWVNNLSVYRGYMNSWIEANVTTDTPQDTLGYLKLYRNDGSSFTDVSEEANIDLIAFATDVSTADLNGDGWLDVYVTNDYFLPDYYFINNGDGTFTEQGKLRLTRSPLRSKGCDVADIDNDAKIDIAVMDITPDDYRDYTKQEQMESGTYKVLSNYYKFLPQSPGNVMMISNGLGSFQDVSRAYDMQHTGWSWSTLLADFDNDGYKDQYITNGIYRNLLDRDFRKMQKQFESTSDARFNEQVYDSFLSNMEAYADQNKVYRNAQGEVMVDMTEQWSVTEPSFSHGAAYGDLDNDGDLDIVVNNLLDTVFILQNQSTATQYLQVQLADTQHSGINTHAELCLYGPGDMVQRVDYTFDRGYRSSVQHRAHFGWTSGQPDSLVVRWRDGRAYTLASPPANQMITIDRNQSRLRPVSATRKPPAFMDITEAIGLDVFKSEFDYPDFIKEPSLPYQYSALGPPLAVGDVDGDGDDDFFVGGSSKSAGQLFVAEGTSFSPISVNTFLRDNQYEDIGAEFVDIDNDGDLDLYVASGGGADIASEDLLEDRLYLNSGNGFFTRSTINIPSIKSSTKSITLLDADGNGYTDLFIGGRNVPGEYPSDAESYLLMNDRGKFRMQDLSAVEDELCGMITDAAATDLDGDGQPELVVVGEYCTPQIYDIVDGQLHRHKDVAVLNDRYGWWQSVTATDIDADGDMDLILGNMGNNALEVSTDRPIKAIRADFDNNGTTETILMRPNGEGQHWPIVSSDELVQLMSDLALQIKSYDDFAKLTIEDMVGQSKVDSADLKMVNDFTSLILINKGNMKFDLEPLPTRAQWAPILDAVVDDYNADGQPDLIVAGNIDNTKPGLAPFDAGRGLLMLGRGDGTFLPFSSIEETGLTMSRDVKEIAAIRLGSRQKGILVANNYDKIQLLLWRDDLFGGR